MKMKKAQADAYETKMAEHDRAQVAYLGAMLDYVAMMADVELPDTERGGEAPGEEA